MYDLHQLCPTSVCSKIDNWIHKKNPADIFEVYKLKNVCGMNIAKKFLKLFDVSVTRKYLKILLQNTVNQQYVYHNLAWTLVESLILV